MPYRRGAHTIEQMSSEQNRRKRDQFCVKQFHDEWFQLTGSPGVFRSAIDVNKPRETALIVIDSGFSFEAMKEAGRIIAYADLTNGKICAGNPTLTEAEMRQFADDPLNHGSIVLSGGQGFSGLAELMPGAPFILVRAFGKENSLLRTVWHDGHIVRPGWTEAYRWAVNFCRQQGMSSVANCSFGGFAHAMDGTGWESRQLAMETGRGKPGHIVVSATGPGDGQPLHASWTQLPGDTRVISAEQSGPCVYNFWSAEPPTSRSSDFASFAEWKLTVMVNSTVIGRHDASYIPDNVWNQRKQLKVPVPGAGKVEFVLYRERAPHLEKSAFGIPQRFDCWVEAGDGRFLDHIDPVAISEPSAFAEVLAIGLQTGKYAPDQLQPGAKPDVLLSGGGPISFRIPVISATVAGLLNNGYHHLDVVGIKSILGKTGTGAASAKTTPEIRKTRIGS